MSPRIAQIWRHPLKGHSRETVDSTVLSTGKTMPGDRVWAVTHDDSRFNATSPEWVVSANFARGSKNPNVMAISSSFNETSGILTLSHPNQPDITFNPDDKADIARFIEWVSPMNVPDKLRPNGIVSVPQRGMTDTDFASISILSFASLADLSAKAGVEVSAKRFRGNFWVEGLKPWQEFDLVGREVTLGECRLKVIEPTIRCAATTANPATGQRDLDTLGLLESNWGHTDFGVYAQVISGGTVKLGDAFNVIGD